MGLTTTKEAARFQINEFSLASPSRHVTFLLCIVSVMCLNTVTLASSGESVDQYQPRSKRSLLQLCAVMSTYTGRNCHDYNQYGCYCGLGNTPGSPVDDVDSCCRSHDSCYGTVSNFLCVPHLVPYTKLCTETNCTCTDSPSTCRFNTCSCDVTFAQCLQNATYHPKYKNWNRAACKGYLNVQESQRQA